MADFVLVHGGLHGGWCFAELERALHALGHRTLAPDLPVDEPGRRGDDYAAAVADAIRQAGLARPWVLGHSLGGFVIPRVALAVPVAGLVYLCAGLPARTEAEHEENLVAFGTPPAMQGSWDKAGCMTLSAASAASAFYHDCPPAQQAWAAARLRPQWGGAFADYAPVPAYPDVPVHAILTDEDALVDPGRFTAMFQKRLGITPVRMPGSHSPFLSRPADLAALLHRLVAA